MNKFIVVALFLGVVGTVLGLPSKREEAEVQEEVKKEGRFEKYLGKASHLAREGLDFLKKLAHVGKEKAAEVLGELKDAAETLIPGIEEKEEEADALAKAEGKERKRQLGP